MQIDETTLRSFKLGRKHADPADQARINAVAFHRTAELLVTSGDDDSLRVYDAASGLPRAPPLLSKKYGAAAVAFTHDPAGGAVIYASRPGAPAGGDHAWRYHDLVTNTYLRYFRGHAGRVAALSLSPRSDLVLSSGDDATVRLWDLRTGGCLAVQATPGPPRAVFDEQGLVFAVGADAGVLKLYDARAYAAGPFAAFTAAPEARTPAPFSHLRFSADGRRLLAVVEGRIYVLDAFSGDVVAALRSGSPDGTPGPEAALSPCGRYVLSGCADAAVRAWAVDGGAEVARWDGHPRPPGCLRWSPRRMLVASACSVLGLWIPDLAALGNNNHGGAVKA